MKEADSRKKEKYIKYLWALHFEGKKIKQKVVQVVVLKSYDQ